MKQKDRQRRPIANCIKTAVDLADDVDREPSQPQFTARLEHVFNRLGLQPWRDRNRLKRDIFWSLFAHKLSGAFGV